MTIRFREEACAALLLFSACGALRQELQEGRTDETSDASGDSGGSTSTFPARPDATVDGAPAWAPDAGGTDSPPEVAFDVGPVVSDVRDLAAEETKPTATPDAAAPEVSSDSPVSCQSRDDCGVCNGQNASKDCAGVCYGKALKDGCGVCDSDPSNDCWAGKHGTMLLGEKGTFNLGSGEMSWSVAGGQQAYFYVGTETRPQLTIANAITPSKCPTDAPGGPYPGYTGATAVQDIRNVMALTFTAPGTSLLFGTRASTCSMGLLVFKQGNHYGVIDFVSIDASSRLMIKYWLADPGVTDFSKAP